MPASQDVTFVMSPPLVVAARDGVVEDSLVVFCVDISGSMCVTTEVCCQCRISSCSIRVVKQSVVVIILVHEG